MRLHSHWLTTGLLALALALALFQPLLGAAASAAEDGLAATSAPASTPTATAGIALRLASCDLVVRPPALFRLTVAATVTPEQFDAAGYALDISLERGDELLASDQIRLDRLGQLSPGIAVVLAPGLRRGPDSALPAILSVLLTSADHHLQERVVRALPTAGSLAALLVHERALLLQRQEPNPLPWLWWEQGREITASPANSERCHDLLGLLQLLQDADQGQLPPAPLTRAWRDPVDTSIQPERVHALADAVSEAWVLATPPTAVIKSDWPSLPGPWLQAAARAHCTVVEPYPAGDRSWQGIAALRAERRLRAHAHGRVLLVGVGAAGAAALRIAACDPGLVAAVRLVDPPPGEASVQAPPGILVSTSWTAEQTEAAPGGLLGMPDPGAPAPASAPGEPAFWTATASAAPVAALPGQLPLPAPACTRLCAYARAPFVVVVGLGEHRAAQEDDTLLARRFIDDWAHHAHGLPPLVNDAEFDARRWRDHVWVLVGNTRSNRVLARLARSVALPVSWDGRSLRLGGATYLRADRRSVAFSIERPDHGLAVVLDGAPGWQGDGLPLAGLDDPALGPPLAAPSPLAPIATGP